MPRSQRVGLNLLSCVVAPLSAAAAAYVGDSTQTSGLAADAQRLAASALDFHAFAGDVGDIRSMAFSPDGRVALTAHWNSTARLFDTTNGEQLQTFTGHSSSVLAVALCASGTLALTGSADGTARLWNVSTGGLVRALTLQSGWASSVACGTSASMLLIGSNSGVSYFWDGDSGKLHRTLDESQAEDGSSGVISVGLNEDGTVAMTSRPDGSAQLWEAATGKPLGRRLKGHKGWILAASFSPDGDALVTGSHDRGVRVWSAERSSTLRTLDGHYTSVNCVALSQDGTLVLSGSQDGVAYVWDAETGELLRTFRRDGPIVAVGFGSDHTRGRSQRAIIGWLKKQKPKPKRNDREQCEAECAAKEAEEGESQMPIFEMGR